MTAIEGGELEPRRNRAEAAENVIGGWKPNRQRTVTAAFRRALLKPNTPLAKATYWVRYDGKGVLHHLMETYKAFWLRSALKQDILPKYLEQTSTGHRFTKKELVPLLANEDRPELRMLALKLMRSTLLDAEKAPVRMRNR